MDPVSLIAAAVVGGLAAGTKDAAGSAVHDAYDAVRRVLARRLTAHPNGMQVLEADQMAPAVWEARLAAALRQMGAGEDGAAIVVAGRVMAAGAAKGKYSVDLRGARAGRSGMAYPAQPVPGRD